MTGRFIAIDWGTTNRRVYVIDDGKIVVTERDAVGVVAVPPDGFEAEIGRLASRHGRLPMLMAGMVGSNRGWVDAGYVACPATLDSVAAALVRPADGIAIVPGVRQIVDGRGDVMRGEEVQLLGAVAAGLAPCDALLCQPGTHCKWAVMRDGAITGFATAMTGEMFALLKHHALIGAAMTAPARVGTAFADGVAASADGDLLGELFGVRPASLLGLRDDADAASFVSGLLIGSDCRARIGAAETVHVLGDPNLGCLYATAITALGGHVRQVDGNAAFVAGITRLWELSR